MTVSVLSIVIVHLEHLDRPYNVHVPEKAQLVKEANWVEESIKHLCESNQNSCLVRKAMSRPDLLGPTVNHQHIFKERSKLATSEARIRATVSPSTLSSMVSPSVAILFTWRCAASPMFVVRTFDTTWSLSRFLHVTTDKRGTHTDGDLTIKANEDVEDHMPCSHEPEIVSQSNKMLNQDDNNSSVKYRALSNLRTSMRHDLAMVFTCKVCETRSVKTTCRESYEKGVVVARCEGCNNLHLIADRLGWFGEPGSIEDLLAARGEEVKKGSIDSLNLTLEDLAGMRSS
ncbi:zim17-type zinc finger protein [Tasmannia lanceolata]|uniref:zim17-type zinc finger protein n=1 Tax=Tasmannia lanceolata TaxID=3420 RepID=UPI0040632AA4